MALPWMCATQHLTRTGVRAACADRFHLRTAKRTHQTGSGIATGAGMSGQSQMLVSPDVSYRSLVLMLVIEVSPDFSYTCKLGHFDGHDRPLNPTRT